jgi:transposase-like protein
LETVAVWQNRPPETSYPRLVFDAVRIKIRDEGLGIAADGTRTVLGL